VLVEGNQQAMEIVFDRYYRMVMRVALRIVRDPGEAQDVVQVVFTDFYRSAQLFDVEKGSLKAWLLQYAYGRSINRKQSLKSRNFYHKVDAESLEAAVSKSSGRLFNLELPEIRMLVEQVLATLGEKQRKVIEMVCFRGMTLAETAAEVGDSLGNVQHTYYRGLEKLRGFLRGHTQRKARPESSDRAPSRKSDRVETRQNEHEMEIVKARSL
jgi:RNA polymerase sigma-70 factor (ECF subfamily)